MVSTLKCFYDIIITNIGLHKPITKNKQKNKTVILSQCEGSYITKIKKSPNTPRTSCGAKSEDIKTEINHLSFTIHNYFVLTNPRTVLINFANSPLVTSFAQNTNSGASSSTHIYAR